MTATGTDNKVALIQRTRPCHSALVFGEGVRRATRPTRRPLATARPVRLHGRVRPYAGVGPRVKREARLDGRVRLVAGPASRPSVRDIIKLVLDADILVLLILGDQVVHVRLGLCELHLIHALAGVPVQESLATEHGCELLREASKDFLNARVVADEGAGHLEAARRDVAHGCLDVVRDPLHEVAAVLVLDVEHLLVHLQIYHDYCLSQQRPATTKKG